MRSIYSYRNGVSFLAHSKVICILDHTGDGLTKVLESVKSAKFFPEGINLYERKGLRGTPKDYLLGVDERLQEGLRAKLGLQPYAEGHCHGGIVHTSKIGDYMESVRQN